MTTARPPRGMTCSVDVDPRAIEVAARAVTDIGIAAPREKAYRDSIRAARDSADLVERNLGLVVMLASRYLCRGLSLADLIQEGNMALMRAAHLYDPSRGVAFSTYFNHRFRAAILKAIYNQSTTVRIPLYVRQDARTLGRARRWLSRRDGRPPSPERLSSLTGISPAKIEALEVVDQVAFISFDAEVGDDDEPLVEVAAGQDASAEEILARGQIIDLVRELVAELPPRTAEIIRARFGMDDGEERLLRDIGARYGITRERTRQIEAAALKKLRQRLAGRGVLLHQK